MAREEQNLRVRIVGGAVDIHSKGIDGDLTIRALDLARDVAYAVLKHDDVGEWLMRRGFMPVGDGWEISRYGLKSVVELHAASTVWMLSTPAVERSNVNTIDRPLLLGEVRAC